MSPAGHGTSGRRRSNQSRRAHIVVRNARPDHGMSSGAKVRISSASRGRRGDPAHDPGLERERHDGRFEAGVEPDDLARLDQQPGLLPGLPDRGLVDGLVDLEEAARLRPLAASGLDAAAQQHDLAVVGDREDGDDEARIDVDDVAACRAGQPVTVLARRSRRTGARRRSSSRISGSGPSTAARHRPMAGPSSGRPVRDRSRPSPRRDPRRAARRSPRPREPPARPG